MNIYFIGVFISFLSFFLQIWPRFKKVYFGVDPWRHLMVAEYIRKHKRVPEALTEKYITSAPFGYPPILSLFLSLFPKKFTEKYNFIFSPIFDSLHNYIIFLTAYFLSNNLVVAITAQTIAVLTPVIVLEASILNPRILSYLLTSLSFLSLLLSSVNGELLWLAIAGVVLFLLFFSHRFGIQVYIFLVVVFSLVERNPLYVEFFLLIFFLVVILGGKRYKLILNEHIESLRYWYKNIDNRFIHQFRESKKSAKKIEFVRSLFILSQRLPFVIILGENPWIFLFLVLLVVKSFNILALNSAIPDLFLNKLILWNIVLLVVSLLVLSIKKLRFIGEGYRYIEYLTLPLSIIVASYIPFFLSNFSTITGPFLAFTFMLLLSVILLLQRKIILSDRNRTVTYEKWEIINYLNKNVGDKLRLAVFPQQEGDALLYFAKGKVLTADSLINLAKINDFYPVIKKPMKDIIKKYRLNYIFLDKQYVTFQELGLKKYKVIKDINDFVLIKV